MFTFGSQTEWTLQQDKPLIQLQAEKLLDDAVFHILLNFFVLVQALGQASSMQLNILFPLMGMQMRERVAINPE